MMSNPSFGHNMTAGMNFPKHEINEAIAWAMNTPSGVDYLDEEKEDSLVFKQWGEAQMSRDQRDSYDMLSGMYGETIALVSVLRIMDRWAAQR